MNLRRRIFFSEMTKNILQPYEASRIYEEQIVGEFENQFEKEYFNCFIAEIGEKGIILDLACGDGRHTLQLSKNANFVVAFDFSLNNLFMARKKCLGCENIEFVKGSFFELPFHKNLFDGIWFSQAFEYVPPDRRDGILASIRQLLKPTGIFYMSAETWMNQSLWSSLKDLWSDFKLFFYWKFVKRKPLLWGEFLYYLSAEDIRDRCSGWHYHVHIDKWTLLKHIGKMKSDVKKLDLYHGYIYTLCQMKSAMLRKQ